MATDSVAVSPRLSQNEDAGVRAILYIDFTRLIQVADTNLTTSEAASGTLTEPKDSKAFGEVPLHH